MTHPNLFSGGVVPSNLSFLDTLVHLTLLRVIIIKCSIPQICIVFWVFSHRFQRIEGTWKLQTVVALQTESQIIAELCIDSCRTALYLPDQTWGQAGTLVVCEEICKDIIHHHAIRQTKYTYSIKKHFAFVVWLSTWTFHLSTIAMGLELNRKLLHPCQPQQSQHQTRISNASNGNTTSMLPVQSKSWIYIV
jgi:hypothetical protein